MKYQHRVLGMLSLLSVITYLDRVCIAVAGPRMQDALQISFTENLDNLFHRFNTVVVQ